MTTESPFGLEHEDSEDHPETTTLVWFPTLSATLIFLFFPPQISHSSGVFFFVVLCCFVFSYIPGPRKPQSQSHTCLGTISLVLMLSQHDPTLLTSKAHPKAGILTLSFWGSPRDRELSTFFYDLVMGTTVRFSLSSTLTLIPPLTFSGPSLSP